ARAVRCRAARSRAHTGLGTRSGKPGPDPPGRGTQTRARGFSYAGAAVSAEWNTRRAETTRTRGDGHVLARHHRRRTGCGGVRGRTRVAGVKIRDGAGRVSAGASSPTGWGRPERGRGARGFQRHLYAGDG